MLNYDENYTDNIVNTLRRLVSIPSPTGFSDKAAEFIKSELVDLGYSPILTNRGNVLCSLGGSGSGLILAAHFDTLGAMVRSIKSNGRIRITKIGGLSLGSVEAENCRVFTYDGKTYTGTLQMNNPSAHVAGSELQEGKRTEESMEVVLDYKTMSADDTKSLGIETGNFIAFDPRFTETETGYVKSRFLDDKAGCAILLTLARYLKEMDISLNRESWLLFTCHEEVGTGAASGLPEADEFLSVDMGCIGDDLSCDETMVSICVKDSGGPYDLGIVSKLVRIAKNENISYACDVYPYYGSDANAAVRAGYHMRHGCIGPGIYASHGYERGHRDGFENTLKLIIGYALAD
jgi:putative aminopeptidase FrvX